MPISDIYKNNFAHRLEELLSMDGKYDVTIDQQDGSAQTRLDITWQKDGKVACEASIYCSSSEADWTRLESKTPDDNEGFLTICAMSSTLFAEQGVERFRATATSTAAADRLKHIGFFQSELGGLRAGIADKEGTMFQYVNWRNGNQQEPDWHRGLK